MQFFAASIPKLPTSYFTWMKEGVDKSVSTATRHSVTAVARFSLMFMYDLFWFRIGFAACLLQHPVICKPPHPLNQTAEP